MRLMELLTSSLPTLHTGNTGNLPLVLVASLGSNPALPFLNGTAELGLQYVILSNFSAAFIQFPLAFSLLRKQPQEQQHKQGEAKHSASSSEGQGQGSVGGPSASKTGTEGKELQLTQLRKQLEDGLQGVSASDAKGVMDSAETQGQLLRILDTPESEWQQHVDSLRIRIQQQVQLGATTVPGADDSVPLLKPDHNAQPGSTSGGSSHVSGLGPSAAHKQRQLQAIWEKAKPVLSGVFTAPTISCLIAVLVASIPPAQVRATSDA